MCGNAVFLTDNNTTQGLCWVAIGCGKNTILYFLVCSLRMTYEILITSKLTLNMVKKYFIKENTDAVWMIYWKEICGIV